MTSARRAVSTEVVRFEGVTVRRSGRTIVDAVDWTVRAGEHWAVLGPNGAGKTTLLRIASAEIHPSRGAATVLGGRFGRVSLPELRARIGVVEPLLARSFYPEQTALDVVLSGATGTVFPLGGDVERARGLLALVGLSGLEERSFAICSEGERARVMLARALLADAPLLVLDEPAAGLDLGGRALLLDAFDLLAREHPELASITVMHHLDELPAATTHALLLRDGRAVASGELDAAITGETLSEAFGLPLQVERMNGRLYARGEMPTSSPPSSS
jgi:iron complex transport system ATP-binding protein